MRILRLECRKLLNWKLLLCILAFSVLFHCVFLEYRLYPDGSAEAAADVELAGELMEETGPVLPLSEWYLLDEKREEQVKKLDAVVGENEVLKKYGITDWEEQEQALSELLDRLNEGKITDEETKLLDEINRIHFESNLEDTFLLQIIDYYRESLKEGPSSFGVAGEDVQETIREEYRSGYSQDYINRMTKLCTRQEISLLPFSTLNYVQSDLPRVGLLLIVSCMLLILPRQIRERMDGVEALHVSTRTGRKIWDRQFQAALCMGGLLSLTQLAVYAVILWKKGIFQFAACPASGHGVDDLWFDLSFGMYLVIYFAMIFLYGLIASALMHLISRKVPNYIVGFAAAVPVVLLLGILDIRINSDLFELWGNMSDAWMPVIVAGLLLLVTAAAAFVMHMNDRKKDVRE